MAQQQQQQGGGDNALAPVWITLLLFITLYIIWALGHTYIVSFVFYLNILQAKIINFLVSGEQLNQEVYLMKTINPETVSLGEMFQLTKSIGSYTRYPFGIVLILLALLLYKSNIKLKFRKTYDMKKLRAQEQYNWPAIMPVVKEDLVAADINKGPWAMGLTPMEFARKYKLLRKDDALLDNPQPGQEMTAGIRRGDAKRIFTLQLGPYWSDFDHCSPHIQAIAAVFMARINRDRAAAKHILETIDKTFAEGKPNFSVAINTLNKYKNTEAIQVITSKHAYLLTMMASMLQAARNDGVVPCAEMLWLKPYDRRLWYMLNCVGRQTPYSEVAGPFAHWKAELLMGRRSLVPMIDEAIKALEIAIKEVKLTPQEMQELEP